MRVAVVERYNVNAWRIDGRREVVDVNDLGTVRIVMLVVSAVRTSVTVLSPSCYETDTGCTGYVMRSLSLGLLGMKSCGMSCPLHGDVIPKF